LDAGRHRAWKVRHAGVQKPAQQATFRGASTDNLRLMIGQNNLRRVIDGGIFLSMGQPTAEQVIASQIPERA